MLDRYVVTGATGFIGSCLTRRLLERGQVLGIGRSLPDSPPLRLALLHADISRPIPDVPAFAEPVVIHTAAARNGADQFKKINVDGTVNALEWAVRHQARHFIHFSTGGVYGYASNHCWSEDEELHPIGDYGQSKLESEHAARACHDRHGLPVTILRLFFPFGPGQKQGIFPLIDNSVCWGKPLTIHRDGAPRINPIHVEDAVDAVEHLLDPDGFRVFNLCGDEVLTFLELVRRAEALQGREAVLDFSGQAQGDLLGDNRRLKTAGWKPVRRLPGCWNELWQGIRDVAWSPDHARNIPPDEGDLRSRPAARSGERAPTQATPGLMEMSRR